MVHFNNFVVLDEICHWLKLMYLFLRQVVSSVQMKSWAGKALETVNCCAFLKRRLIGAC
jgi:hypothetical protein